MYAKPCEHAINTYLGTMVALESSSTIGTFTLSLGRAKSTSPCEDTNKIVALINMAGKQI